jgi:hypothetical protein
MTVWNPSNRLENSAQIAYNKKQPNIKIKAQIEHKLRRTL